MSPHNPISSVPLPLRIARPLLVQPVFWLGVVVWITLSGIAAILIVQTGGLPFNHHLPALEGKSPLAQLLNLQINALFGLTVMGFGWLLTRNRSVPDIATRTPSHQQTRRELVVLIGYGIFVQLVGLFLGSTLGMHPISLHLTGTLFGTYDTVPPTEVWVWVTFNFVTYALLPYLYFRSRGYSNQDLSLRSSNPRADIIVILGVMALEAVGELSTYKNVFGLNASQLLIGIPLSFLVNFFGTVLPIMIYLVSLIFPRLLRLTGSFTATTLLGGLAYALLHIFDSWAVYTSPSASVLSVIFVLLQYTVPGMIKVVLTVRTANAWVHALGYHAVAPHVTVDTPLIVKIFGIR
jgi:hypothetical protein